MVGPGSNLRYFTGVEWGLSERFFGMALGRRGDPVWVVPAFGRGRGLEQTALGGDVRAWEEDESPHALVARALKDLGATGRVGVEEAMPFAFSDRIAQAAPALRLVSATPVTAGYRMVKDAHELALMRRAVETTVRAHCAVFASLKEGATVAEVSAWSVAAHRRLGARGGSLVLFGPDAAFPHGTEKPRPLRAGDVVLMDDGCRVHGCSSDVTRTAVFGAPPTDRQRLIWDTVSARGGRSRSVLKGRPSAARPWSARARALRLTRRPPPQAHLGEIRRLVGREARRHPDEDLAHMLRHAPPPRRRRRPAHPGAARPREAGDDGGLHPRGDGGLELPGAGASEGTAAHLIPMAS